jgi:hypothetical protein
MNIKRESQLARLKRLETNISNLQDVVLGLYKTIQELKLKSQDDVKTIK